MNPIAQHYDALAPRRDGYRKRNRYYYEQIFSQYSYLIPKGKRVLEIGCGTGELLCALEPAYGLGIDISSEMVKIARAKFPHLHFEAGEIGALTVTAPFDYIVLSGLIGELPDIQEFFAKLKPHCHPRTRIIVEYYSVLWQYLLALAEKFQFKMPQRLQNWVTYQDIENFLALTGYETVKKERHILCPQKVWLLSWFFNKFLARLPLLNALTLSHMIIARPRNITNEELSVTVLIPCRNEKGNIADAIARTPPFGKSQEFLFVEGGSQDGTYEEVQRIIKANPQKDIKLFKQTGRGKGDAVRLGFEKAKGEVLMILDADLTVAPEDLPKFYEAIRANRGEFINGSRLVYPREKEAMRFLNLLANKFFGVFFSWLLGQRFKDTLCGTKVLFKKDYEEIVANRSYFGDFDPFGDFDLIFGASKLNLKVIELPIRYRERRYGTTQIQRFRHGMLLFRMCFFAMRKIKFR